MRQILIIAFLASNIVLPAFADPYQSRDNVPRTYMDSSYSGTAQQNNRFGLPHTVFGPGVGRPGDSVSKGYQVGGAPIGAVQNSAIPTATRLPACVMGQAVRTPGDNMRSDMRRQINGQPMQSRPMYQQQNQQAKSQYAQAFTYSSYPKSPQ